jgi:hypothetical protein
MNQLNAEQRVSRIKILKRGPGNLFSVTINALEEPVQCTVYDAVGLRTVPTSTLARLHVKARRTSTYDFLDTAFQNGLTIVTDPPAHFLATYR